MGRVPTVEDLMTPAPLHTVRVHERVDTAELLMQHHHVRHLPVVTAEHLVGIVSDRDLHGDPRSRSEPASDVAIGQIMTPVPETTARGTAAAMAATSMLDHRIGALPVMEDGELVGIISRMDFVRFLVSH